MMTSVTKAVKFQLLNWYQENKRPLPWRRNRDAYPVWISETMLQQTTSQAVIPYFERFLKRFPKLSDLANGRIEDVYEVWAGLGYYSRARNLHKASQILNQIGFQKNYLELIKLPGFGPYTARAVASIAFDESVGVIDGNTIRVVSRLEDQPFEWWKQNVRKHLQLIVDSYVADTPSHLMNQALMELGATICTPKSPACFLCPMREVCGAFKNNTVSERPLKKPRREREIWAWQPSLEFFDEHIGFITNDYAPFLKGQLLLPGKVMRLDKRPERFDFRHSITHHDIYVTVTKKISKLKKTSRTEIRWIKTENVKQIVPLALVQKTIRFSQK